MKKLITSTLGFFAACVCLGTMNAWAEYVVPRVAPSITAPVASAQWSLEIEMAGGDPPPPPTIPNVQWVTNPHDSGSGSLRSAISNAAAGDTIRFALRRLPATILLRSTLVIDKDLKILGPDPRKITVARTFSAHAPNFRVFQVDAGLVTIAGLSIVNGRALNPDGFSDNLGGGILNSGSLTVSNCVIACNEAPAENGGNGFGGGIFTLGRLRVINSTIRANEANFAGGGICTFHTDNVRIEGCTISGNYAGVQGGGINFQGRTGSLKNSTISGNKTAEDGTASGLLHLVFVSEASDLDLTACTIADNCGNTNGAVVLAALPGNLGSNTRMIGTLTARNKTQNFRLDGNPFLQSLGNNLDSDGTSGLTNGVNGDLVGTLASPLDVRISWLQDNGGPTRTHALLVGSPALDAGVCLDVDGNPLLIDQRGRPRPQGAACDIGAFENQPPQVRCPTAHYVETCDGELSAVVQDPDGDPLTVIWVVDGAAFRTNYVMASHPPYPRTVNLRVALTPGNHAIAVRVSDGKAPEVECSTTVTARDRKPPKIISIKANPKILWPPNHQLVPVNVTVQAVDSCGPVTCRIVSVHSSEPVDAGPDWVITGDLTVLLRAERLANGPGRTYKINVQCRDGAGNTSLGTTVVFVPQHQ